MMTGLKGAPRIVFEELKAMLTAGEPVSVMRLSERSMYHPYTVHLALKALQTWGMVCITPTRPGCRNLYALGDAWKN